MPTTTIQFFAYSHFPVGPLRDMSKRFSDLAQQLEDSVPDSPEKSAGMRKLLEAKDCFVRTALERKED